MWLTAPVSVLAAFPAYADVVPANAVQLKKEARNAEVAIITDIPQLSDIPRPHTRVKDWLAQEMRQNKVTLVTGVRLSPTTTGLEVILENPTSDKLQTTTKSEGNTFSAVIINAQLRLPSGNSFRSNNPASGITAVTVANQDANSILVTVTGSTSVPKVELFDSDQGLIFAFTPTVSNPQQQQQQQTPETLKPSSGKPPAKPSSQGEEPIELLVTGEPEDSYNVSNATTATKFPVPLRDIPQSIQVIPRQVIEDRQVVRLDELTDNVSGVQRQIGFGTASGYIIRGFANYGSLRNGFRQISSITPGAIDNLDRVEFLKGPASVLYGSGISQGGIVNTVTKKPLDTPFYSASFTAGNYSYYRPSLDITGPLTSDRSLFYRLNTSYENAGSYRDFTDNENFLFAPALTWRIGKRTTFSTEVEYQNSNFVYESGFPRVPESLRLPINRFLSEPSLDRTHLDSTSITYNLEHKFSDNWNIRQGFNTLLAHIDVDSWLIYTTRPLVNGQILDRSDYRGSQNVENYTLQNEIFGKFNTGPVRHNLLVGLELFRSTLGTEFSSASLGQINIFKPVYGAQPGPFRPSFFSSENNSDNLGVYVQDLVEILPNLKLLAGVRFDSNDSSSKDRPGGKLIGERSENKFSPRVGIVYQPSQSTSLYFNWTNYFNPQVFSGRSQTGEVFKPETAEQFEVGIKQDFLDNRLSATLALYQLTRQNLLTTDPVDPTIRIQTGEQKSRGVELDVAGQILPGWNVIATYAYTDAFVSKDKRPFFVDDQLVGAPYHSASLWTTYELQSPNWKGLGFGLGLVYAGDVQVSLPNSFKAPSYLRTDASLFYRRNNFRVGLNFKNLFNIKYFYTDGNVNAIYPAPPLTVLGTVSVQF